MSDTKRTENQWIDEGLDAFAAYYTAGTSTSWINGVQDAIRSANAEIDNVLGSYVNYSAEQLGGFYAEAYHPGSFNINAAKADSEHFAYREGSTANGSADIKSSWGDDYGSKYHKNAANSLARQAEAKSGPDGYRIENTSKYAGQERLIPSDQLEKARTIAKTKVNKELVEGNYDTAARYDETGTRLTDRMRTPDGTESKPLTKAEADQWAKDAQEGNVRHFDIQNEVLVREHLTQIGKAAGGAAAISVALQAAPVVVGALNRLIREPDFTAASFGREIGTWAKEQGGAIALDAFTKAALGGSLATAQQLGHLGGPLANATPATLGGVAVVTVESMKALWAWQQGRCTGEQAVSQTFVCGVKTAAALKGAAVGQAMIPIPVVGAIVGSMAGSFLAEHGMESMSNTTTMVLLEEVDRTFTSHQQHVNLLATSHRQYQVASEKYDAIIARGSHLINAADMREVTNEEIQDNMKKTEKLAETAETALLRRLDLWEGK